MNTVNSDEMLKWYFNNGPESGNRMTLTKDGNLSVTRTTAGNTSFKVISKSTDVGLYGAETYYTYDRGTNQGAFRLRSKYDGANIGTFSLSVESAGQGYGQDPYALTYTDLLTINRNGNMGIGTDSPQAKLELTQGMLWLTGQDTNNANLPGLGLYGGNNSAGLYFRGGTDEIKKLNIGVHNGDIVFSTGGGASQESLKISNDGTVHAQGTIKAKELVITATPWADFVFEPDYKLKTLPEVEAYIAANKRLPDMPSEDEVKEKGANVGDVQMKLLQKIEELTLYVIEQNKMILKQQKEIDELKSKQ